MTRALVGLGSNRAGPRHQLDAALTALASLPETELAAVSPRYRTVPVGDRDQPDFVNAVAALDTGLDAFQLLRQLQRIERDQGRERDRQRRWGPRTIDLDLLVFGSQTIDDPELTVPHPRLGQRAFVLRPLADVAPGLDIPGVGPVETLLACVDTAGVRPIDGVEPR